MNLLEREVLKESIKVLRSYFKLWVKVERRTSGLFKNMGGKWVRVGRVSEPDIGGWVLQGHYIAKPIVIEAKRTSFDPRKLSKADAIRFHSQFEYLQEINKQGGVGFWINDPCVIHHVLWPVLMHGEKVSFDRNRYVVVTQKNVNVDQI